METAGYRRIHKGLRPGSGTTLHGIWHTAPHCIARTCWIPALLLTTIVTLSLSHQTSPLFKSITNTLGFTSLATNCSCSAYTPVSSPIYPWAPTQPLAFRLTAGFVLLASRVTSLSPRIVHRSRWLGVVFTSTGPLSPELACVCVYKYPRRAPSHLLDGIRRGSNSNEDRRRAASSVEQSRSRWLILICASSFHPKNRTCGIDFIRLVSHRASALRSPAGSQPKPQRRSSRAHAQRVGHGRRRCSLVAEG